ncbi:MAG: cobalamin-dependent protein, partial [Deltaproteobacteria bacterium]|nr:cobalamin-dependent protein [Deltaproteobacteria bacterium]
VFDKTTNTDKLSHSICLFMGKLQIYDCVLIHTPKFNHYFHPLGKVGFINIIPTGLFAIADALSKNNFNVRILHLGVEKITRPSLKIKDIIQQHKALVYGISLMWHYQIYDAIEVAKAIKEVHPGSYVILGGLTASLFRDDILHKHSCVDGILEGESELSMVKLMEEINRNTKSPSFPNVPNLSFRDGNNIIKPRQKINTSRELFDTLRFVRPDLLNNAANYSKLHFFTKYTNPVLTKMMNITRFWTSSLWYITLGRGCPYACSFCAARHNLKHILYRSEPLFRKTDSVLEDIDILNRFGIKRITSAFYYDKNEDYFINFIKEYSRYYKNISLNFDCWSIPPLGLIDEFAALNNESNINIVIYSLSEKLRRLNHIHQIDNGQLINATRYAKRKNVRLKFTLISGLPFEDDDTINETLNIANIIRKEHPGCQIVYAFNEISPFSDMCLNPSQYNVVISARNYDEFYKINSSGRFFVGYSFNNMSEKQIQIKKCERQCFINPYYGKHICRYMNKITKHF